ncbi:hypothetical protein [Nocardioides sp. NPDC006273]|uniref:hypothetical protein n=1 Tax=Nocardioides sp. NPDC006273 TaxID=3155598 RepID=UPI0033A31813
MAISNAPVAAAHGGDAEPVEGTYRAVVHDVPPGVVVHPLQGRIAGFYAEVGAGHQLVVRATDGGELARIGAAGSAASGSWLEKRVRMPAEQSTHDHLAVVDGWSVPVTYDGDPAAIRGVVEWVPVGPQHDDHGTPAGVAIGTGGGALVTATVGLVLLRRWRRATSAASR